MTIKEVEKLTGLTAKAIRHYEKEGLISINRDKMNLYRNYSEKDVEVLKNIKIFRYLDFSIEEIKTILQKENEEISELLINKVEFFEQKAETHKIKKDFCVYLSKQYKKGKINIDEYDEIIQFEEDEELKEVIKNIETPSIYLLIFQTLIIGGPIISLFLNIELEKWKVSLNAILAIISTVILTLNYKKYIYYYKNRKKTVKKRNKEDKFLIPILFIVLVLSITIIVAYISIMEKLIAPDNWLFYQINPHFEMLLPVCIVFQIYFIILFLKKKELINKKRIISILSITAIIIYTVLTNVTFVTDEHIVCYSPFNLKGKQYQYSDVSNIEAKFGDKKISLFHHNKKGNFQYIVNIDGKKIIFSQPSTNAKVERYNDTYVELEEFDEKLMNLDINKESDETNSKYCNYDKVYIDRFLRIIRNN